MLDREQFYYLFVHANSLAELGLRFAAAEIEREMEAQTAEPPRAAGDLPDHAPGFDGLDFDTLDFDALDTADPAGGPETPLETGGLPTGRGARPDAGTGLVDLDRYLDRAYTHEERLRVRIDAAFEKADTRLLRGLLDRAPAELPSLTGRLRGDGLDLWLDRFKARDEVVSEIVLQIRQLEA